MSNFNPKQGEMILVGHGQGCPVCMREFVVLLAGVYHCKSHNADEIKLIPWEYAKPLPDKPEPIPFTREAWPKQVVWLRRPIHSPHLCAMVGNLYHGGVIVGGHYLSFEDLKEKGYEMSLDHCATWQPCHYNPNPTE